MKKLIALLLAAFMSMSVLAACSNNEETPEEPAETPAEEPAEEEPAEEEPADANPLPEWDAYDALIRDIKSSTDFVAREALMHEAEDMLMETFALVLIY